MSTEGKEKLNVQNYHFETKILKKYIYFIQGHVMMYTAKGKNWLQKRDFLKLPYFRMIAILTLPFDLPTFVTSRPKINTKMNILALRIITNLKTSKSLLEWAKTGFLIYCLWI